MKTFTIITQFVSSHGRQDGYVIVRRYGHTLSREYFSNYNEHKSLVESISEGLRVQGATHFKYILN